MVDWDGKVHLQNGTASIWQFADSAGCFILVFDVRRGDSNNATTAKQPAKTISEPKQAWKKNTCCFWITHGNENVLLPLPYDAHGKYMKVHHGDSADQWKNCNFKLHSCISMIQHVSAYNYNGISSCHLLPSQLLEAVAHGQSACATTASPWRQCAGEAPAHSARCSGDGWGWWAKWNKGGCQAHSKATAIPHHTTNHSTPILSKSVEDPNLS